MNAIVICECSDMVTNALIERGINAHSCDLKPSEHDSPNHSQCDFRELDYSGIDLVIAHPDCTRLANSGVRWLHERPELWDDFLDAVRIFNVILGLNVPKICVENPIHHKYARKYIRKYDQIIQPYQFGEDASKATCLWLKGLPKLKPTKYIEPHYRCRCGGLPFEYELGKYGCPNCCGEHIARLVWGNQTPSGQNNEPPGENQKTNRARTYRGIAEAMANQWG